MPSNEPLKTTLRELLPIMNCCKMTLAWRNLRILYTRSAIDELCKWFVFAQIANTHLYGFAQKKLGHNPAVCNVLIDTCMYQSNSMLDSSVCRKCVWNNIQDIYTTVDLEGKCFTVKICPSRLIVCSQTNYMTSIDLAIEEWCKKIK